jgi:hypothetical protein
MLRSSNLLSTVPVFPGSFEMLQILNTKRRTSILQCSLQWYCRPKMHLRRSHAICPRHLLVLGLLVHEAFPCAAGCQTFIR